MLVKLDHFPNFRGENKKYVKPPADSKQEGLESQKFNMFSLRHTHSDLESLTGYTKGIYMVYLHLKLLQKSKNKKSHRHSNMSSFDKNNIFDPKKKQWHLLPFFTMVDDQVLLHLRILASFLAHLILHGNTVGAGFVFLLNPCKKKCSSMFTI